MPNYDYSCTSCETSFEKKLPFEDVDKPSLEPCPKCETIGTVSYTPSFSGIADPIRLGVRRPPSEFVNGVLGRMEHSVPNGIRKTNRGYQVNKVKFDGRYTPTR